MCVCNIKMGVQYKDATPGRELLQLFTKMNSLKCNTRAKQTGRLCGGAPRPAGTSLGSGAGHRVNYY